MISSPYWVRRDGMETKWPTAVLSKLCQRLVHKLQWDFPNILLPTLQGTNPKINMEQAPPGWVYRSHYFLHNKADATLLLIFFLMTVNKSNRKEALMNIIMLRGEMSPNGRHSRVAIPAKLWIKCRTAGQCMLRSSWTQGFSSLPSRRGIYCRRLKNQ